MDAGILYMGNRFKILNFRHDAEDEARGNPYNCSFDIEVVSGLFSGYAPCKYSYKDWQEFVQSIEDLYNFKADSAQLWEIGHGSKVNFKSDGRGHIEISGKIYGEISGSAREQVLEFCFDADQTVFPRFIRDLKRL